MEKKLIEELREVTGECNKKMRDVSDRYLQLKKEEALSSLKEGNTNIDVNYTKMLMETMTMQAVIKVNEDLVELKAILDTSEEEIQHTLNKNGIGAKQAIMSLMINDLTSSGDTLESMEETVKKNYNTISEVDIEDMMRDDNPIDFEF